MTKKDKRTREAYHDYWKDPEHESEFPCQFIGPFERSKLLYELLKHHLGGGSVLEVGCGAGANLAYLHTHGYDELAGIELNDTSLSLFAEHYPETYTATKVYNAPAEDVLPRLETDEYDAVIAITVLAHIHPDSEFLFDDIVRVARQNLVIIENEETDIDIFVPRDYGEVFTERGCTQLDHRSPEETASRTNLSTNCHARVFEVN